jgi:hypothetical protein
MTSWENKADKVIAALCFAAWEQANPRGRNGQRPKKHRPYQVPELASRLVSALGLHDAREREESVKALLLQHNYRELVGATDATGVL